MDKSVNELSSGVAKAVASTLAPEQNSRRDFMKGTGALLGAAAMAAVLTSPFALAETANVNVYGSIDGGLRSATAGGATANTFGSGFYNLNKWGFKGTEDLGDGLKANFNLEGSFNTGTGAQEAATPNLFGRFATVGVSGDFGKIDLGRQFSVSYRAMNAYMPFGIYFLSLSVPFATPSAVFYDNDIQYTAKFDDLVVLAERTVPATGDSSTSVSALGFRYVTNTIIAGAAYTATKPAAGSLADRKHYTAGGGYKFSDSKVFVGYAKDETTATGPATTGAKASYMWLGATYDVSGKIGVTAAYYKRSTEIAATVAVPAAELKSSRMIVAGTYALSKRTNLYIEADRTTAEAQAAPAAAVTSTDSNGYSLGIAHTF